jgi:putative ABC transport system substrate-binding protein
VSDINTALVDRLKALDPNRPIREADMGGAFPDAGLSRYDALSRMSGEAMRRREFIALLGGASAVWPFIARAQQAAMPVIGYFSARSAESDVPMLAAFRQGLNETGYVEGKNVTIEFRWGDGEYDRARKLAAELVRQQVSIIVTSGGELSARAAIEATTTIPIVFNVGADPVETGLVASVNRPGGNATGVSSLTRVLGAKQIGLLRELVPTATVIAYLSNPEEPTAASQIGDAEAAAREVGQQLIVLNARSENEIDAAFRSLLHQRAGALLVGTGPFFLTRAAKLVALAARHAVPVMYFRREFPEVGGLMSYGSSTAEMYRQMGLYTGRILKGDRPADLPVLLPTKFEFVINLKAAKALGIVVPPTLLARADEVIE